MSAKFRIYHEKSGVKRFVSEVDTEEEAKKITDEANQVESGELVYPGMLSAGRRQQPSGWRWVYVNTEVDMGVMKYNIRCLKGDFQEGETVYLTMLPEGNFEVSSLDGLRMGYAGSHEVDVTFTQ